MTKLKLKFIADVVYCGGDKRANRLDWKAGGRGRIYYVVDGKKPWVVYPAFDPDIDPDLDADPVWYPWQQSVELLRWWARAPNDAAKTLYAIFGGEEKEASDVQNDGGSSSPANASQSS